MNTEIVTKQTTAVGAPIDFSFGTEELISTDLKLPKILLMQAMSEFVKERKAMSGDIVESFEGRKLGSIDQKLEIIPFYFTNTWTIKREVDGKMVFDSVVPRGGNDIRREYETIKDGVKYTNHRTLNIFALIKGGNLTVPYMISLKNSDFKYAAQPFLNKTQLLRAEKKAPAHIVWELGVTDEPNNAKGSWFAFTLEAKKDKAGKDIYNSAEEVQSAYQAYKSLAQSLDSGAQIDMSDVAKEDAPF